MIHELLAPAVVFLEVKPRQRKQGAVINDELNEVRKISCFLPNKNSLL